jgi:hypothetical protein
MNGVPKDLPLHRFVGDSICQIALGMHDVHFHFNKAGSINVEGKWQIYDASGTIVDESIDGLPSTRQHYRVHVIFDSDVEKFDIDAPHSFTLTFANGHKLTIHDESEQYESFSIQPDGIYV